MNCIRFWQRQRCTRRGFYTPPPHPQKTDKKSRQQTESSFTKCKWVLSIWTTSIRLFVCASLNQIKQKVVNKPNRLLLNVMEFSLFGQTVFGFLCAHYTHKIVNKPNRLLKFSILGWTNINWFFVCALYL